MGVVFGLCFMLVSPVVLFVYAINKHLDSLAMPGTRQDAEKPPLREGEFALARRTNDHS